MDAFVETCVKSITTGIREFGTYDPFDKGYAMDFVNTSCLLMCTPEQASTFVGDVLEAVKTWMEKVEYPEGDVKDITSYFARNFAMDWDESFEGTLEQYQTFVKHDPRVLEFEPSLVNGY